MSITPYFDPLLGKLRVSDVGVVSAASVSIPDPLIINNLQVASTASINLIRVNNAVISNATLGLTHISTIDWNLTSGATVTQEGQMNWDANQQTAVIGMAGGNVDLALGMETLFPRRVRNSTGSTMAKGTVVYINGVSGNTPTVERAIATSDMSSAFTLGMTAESIGNNSTGWVTTFGELTGIDLSAYTGGDTLYLSGATAGAFTNVPQSAPIHYVRVGTVVKATTDGALVVNVLNGYELNELHNVIIASLASGQILQSGASSYWYNRSLASAVADLNVLASLGSLAVMNQLSFTSLTNQPSLSSLAFQSTIDYNSAQLLNKPSLGSLAEMNALSFTSLLNQPSLSSLAFQSTVNYSQITNTPSLGSLAIMNQLSYGSLLNLPSLGSLAVMNQLSFTSLINQPSLGSLAIISNVVPPLNLSGTTLSLSIASISHNSLGNLTTGDPHTQYVLSAGRSGGQLVTGGTGNNEVLTFRANTGSSNTITNVAFEWLAGVGGNNSRMVLRQDGALGVNTTPNFARLQVSNGVTAVSGYNNGFQVDHSINKTTGDYIGAYFYVNDVAGGGSKTIYAHRAKVEFNAFPATTLAGMQATSNQMVVSGGNRINYAEVLTSNFDVFDTCVVDEARLIRLFAPNIASTASVSLLIGLDIPAMTRGVTNWSIYSDGGDMYHKGNIGIGITPVAARALTLSDTKNATYSYIGFNEGATERWAIGTQSGEFGIYDSASASFRMKFEPSGEVGIGTGDPTARLDVEQLSTTAAIPTLELTQSDLSEEFINFVSTIGAGNPIIASSTATTFSHKVRVSVNGTFKWLYLYNA